MQTFSAPTLPSSQNAVSAGEDATALPLSGSGRPHVLFLIDHLVSCGGGEGNLLKAVELLSARRVRCSVATFSISPDIRNRLAVPVHLFPWRRFYHLDALKAALRLRALIRCQQVDIVQTYFETSNLWGG